MSHSDNSLIHASFYQFISPLPIDDTIVTGGDVFRNWMHEHISISKRQTGFKSCKYWNEKYFIYLIQTDRIFDCKL